MELDSRLANVHVRCPPPACLLGSPSWWLSLSFNIYIKWLHLPSQISRAQGIPKVPVNSQTFVASRPLPVLHSRWIFLLFRFYFPQLFSSCHLRWLEFRTQLPCCTLNTSERYCVWHILSKGEVTEKGYFVPIHSKINRSINKQKPLNIGTPVLSVTHLPLQILYLALLSPFAKFLNRVIQGDFCFIYLTM